MSALLITIGICFIFGASIPVRHVPRTGDRWASFTGFVLLCIGIALVIVGASWNCGG